MSIDLNQSHRLSHEQGLLLNQVLELRLELRDPSFPNPLRGIEGILAADSLLKEWGAVGLLNGGLAEAVWNQRRTKVELAAHKDVDILVVSKLESIGVIENFAGGIDWWMPSDIHFDSIRTDHGIMENVTRRFWINGNGCTLRYRIKSTADLSPGLYFPSPEMAVDIRMSECLAMIDNSVAVINVDEEAFIEKLREKLGIRSCLPSFITAAMGRNPVPYIGHPGHGQIPFQVDPVPLEEQRALSQNHK